MDDMVMIVAYVRRARRVAVGHALRQLEVGGWSESDVIGHGNAAGGHGVEHVRFELLVPRAHAEACRQSIEVAAAVGSDGDGLIAMLPALSVTRIGVVPETSQRTG